jgi:RDD family protein
MSEFTAPPEPGGFTSPAEPAMVPATRPCPSCGREFGPGAVCQNCGQVEGMPVGTKVAQPGRRLGGALLDALLVIVTLVIGWLIWVIFTSKNGQSPAKKILRMRVVKLSTGQTVTRGQYFARWLGKFVLRLITIVGLLAALWLLWTRTGRRSGTRSPRRSW